MSSIHLHPVHGANPTVLLCPICHESYGVALLGRNLKGIGCRPDREAPPSLIDPDQLCPACLTHSREFIALIPTSHNPQNSLVARADLVTALANAGPRNLWVKRNKFPSIFTGTCPPQPFCFIETAAFEMLCAKFSPPPESN